MLDDETVDAFGMLPLLDLTQYQTVTWAHRADCLLIIAPIAICSLRNLGVASPTTVLTRHTMRLRKAEKLSTKG